MSFAKFGPAGNGQAFYDGGYKSTIEAMKYLSLLSLDCFEYQCGRGVNVGLSTALKIGEAARKYDIELSMHAPYYISLASEKEDLREKSIGYILESAMTLDAMGGKRIIIHSGGLGKRSRENALEVAKGTLAKAQFALDEQGLSHMIICPELMGKVNNLGDLFEVNELCKVDDRFIPCIDFGHYNARTGGAIKSKGDYEYIFDEIANELGEERVKNIHSHFSKIEYSAGGEKKHLTLEDTIFGPDYEPLAKVISERNYTPVIICESAGTQDVDAVIMKSIYLEMLRSNENEKTTDN